MENDRFIKEQIEKLTKAEIASYDEVYKKYDDIYKKIIKGNYKPEFAVKKIFEVNNGYKSPKYLAEDFKKYFIWYYSDETSDNNLILESSHLESLDNFQKYIDKINKLKDKLELLYQIYDQIKNLKI